MPTGKANPHLEHMFILGKGVDGNCKKRRGKKEPPYGPLIRPLLGGRLQGAELGVVKAKRRGSVKQRSLLGKGSLQSLRGMKGGEGFYSPAKAPI